MVSRSLRVFGWFLCFLVPKKEGGGSTCWGHFGHLHRLLPMLFGSFSVHSLKILPSLISDQSGLGGQGGKSFFHFGVGPSLCSHKVTPCWFQIEASLGFATRRMSLVVGIPWVPQNLPPRDPTLVLSLAGTFWRQTGQRCIRIVWSPGSPLSLVV